MKEFSASTKGFDKYLIQTLNTHLNRNPVPHVGTVSASKQTLLNLGPSSVLSHNFHKIYTCTIRNRYVEGLANFQSYNTYSVLSIELHALPISNSKQIC